ncbi:MAG: SsrA-binding protein SmpB [Chloroflexota bacterium]
MPDRDFVTNRRAYHDYHILETLEAGMALTGTETKAIRDGHANVREAYVRADGGELWLQNAHISHYSHGNIYNHEPLRSRKLLVHKRQLKQLIGKSHEPGITLIPLRLYDRKGKIKIEIGVARGKRLYDKREAIAERDAKREIDRAVKQARAAV